MVTKNFKFTTLFNIPIDINYTWFAVVALVVYTLANNYFPHTNPELGALAWWSMSVVAACLLFASLLAHELAHSVVAIRNKLPISGITLFIFGGVAHMESEPTTPRVEFLMAIAGPIMSFALSLVFYALASLFSFYAGTGILVSITSYLSVINFVIGLFNLIPGFPLDGGRILRALFWHYSKDLRRATAVASLIGKGFAFFLIAVGFTNLVQGAVIPGLWFIFMGIFVEEAADTSYKNVVMKKVLGDTLVEKCMAHTVITVGPKIVLNDLVDNYFFKLRHASFPVMSDDLILGIVTLHNVKSIPKENWNMTTAQDIMLPIGEEYVIPKNASILEALSKMATNKIHRLMVVEGGKLVGFISQRDIVKLFEFKTEIG